MEVIPLKVASSTNVIEFIREHIIYRFGVPQSITTDQGKMFTSKEFEDFAASIGFKLINSSPYYAQANGQAKASNQILIKSINKKIKEHHRKWHSILSETLWSCRKASRGSTKCSPYELVYGHDSSFPSHNPNQCQTNDDVTCSKTNLVKRSLRFLWSTLMSFFMSKKIVLPCSTSRLRYILSMVKIDLTTKGSSNQRSILTKLKLLIDDQTN